MLNSITMLFQFKCNFSEIINILRMSHAISTSKLLFACCVWNSRIELKISYTDHMQRRYPERKKCEWLIRNIEDWFACFGFENCKDLLLRLTSNQFEMILFAISLTILPYDSIKALKKKLLFNASVSWRCHFSTRVAETNNFLLTNFYCFIYYACWFDITNGQP